jgi:hypothetical protein
MTAETAFGIAALSFYFALLLFIYIRGYDE